MVSSIQENGTKKAYQLRCKPHKILKSIVFVKLEHIMDENNKLAPQSCLSISAHQVKCNKKIELMSFFHKWIGHKNRLTSHFFR